MVGNDHEIMLLIHFFSLAVQRKPAKRLKLLLNFTSVSQQRPQHGRYIHTTHWMLVKQSASWTELCAKYYRHSFQLLCTGSVEQLPVP